MDIDIAGFSRRANVLGGSQLLLVVKSQDQLERRRRLLASRGKGKYGRIVERPTAVGLLVSGTLGRGHFHPTWHREFREPRHIVYCRDDGELLLSEMNRVLRLSPAGDVIRSYTHPRFGFLHTVEIGSDGARCLVASSGYDCVVELDLDSGQETFCWTAWDHGFNPDGAGFWLAADLNIYERYLAEGKRALLIDPAEYGEQGLITSRRTAHPNVAVYDPYDEDRSILVSIAHSGSLYRVRLRDGGTSLVLDSLDPMPHGLRPYDGGWAVTNTTRGEWWVLDRSFDRLARYSVAGVGGKAHGTDDVEWVQQVIPYHDHTAFFLDANRGILAVDFAERCYSVYETDSNWCIQDAMAQLQ